MKPYGSAARTAAAGSFTNTADFYAAVRRAQFMGDLDSRLVRAPTGADENDPTAGGFLVPGVMADGLIASLYEEAVIAPLVNWVELSGPLADISIPGIDETSRADGSRLGGTQAWWSGEGNAVTASKPKYRKVSFTAKKLIAVAWLTEELMRDVTAMDDHFKRAFGAEMGFKVDAAILAGNVPGIPQGILSSASLITVAKQTGQVSGTIVESNISGMWARLASPCRRRAVWLVNEDAESQFERFGAGPDGSPVLYYPAGVFGNPFPLLKGRPVITVEQAPVLGTLGDIVLADLTQYRVFSGAPDFAISADAGFLSDELVMRFKLRADGNSIWSSPVTPYNGSAITRSPFVTLAAR